MSANACLKAVEPHLPRWSRKRPGGGLLAYLVGDDLRYTLTRKYAEAERLYEELDKALQPDALLLELTDKQTCLIL